MAHINAFIVICLLITVGYFVGFLAFLSDYEENNCEMTYMFQYPQFVRVYMQYDHKFRKYGLYAYSEGRSTERARGMYFDGVPVLFIPGNAGSYKQVRSFASIALHKALDRRPGFHFDFFTIDLNNELSGLNGALLDDQTQYLNHSIYRVLELYNKKHGHVPKSVIVIGHSVGGVIIRGFLRLLPQNSTLIPLVITLATPHKRMPVVTDYYIDSYYYKVQKNGSLPVNTTFISLSGGYSDFLVPPFLTDDGDLDNLNAVTTGVPLDWEPADHLCILWCKQLVLAVTRALFDSVDPRTKQLSTNSTYRSSVFYHHLVQNSGTKPQASDRYAMRAMLGSSNDEWIEKLLRQYSVRLLSGTKNTQWHMIRLINQPNHETVTILALNLELTDWIFACPANDMKGNHRVCSEGIHLSHISEIAPSIMYKRRTMTLNLLDLKKNYTQGTHVVVRVPSSREPVVVHIDIYQSAERKILVNLPRFWALTRQTIIEKTAENVLHYELIFPSLQHITQSYQLYVEPTRCANKAHHATASLSVLWGHQDVHAYFTYNEKKPLHLRLYSSRPANMMNANATVKLMLDPTCRYSISIRPSLIGMLGQMARSYSSLLIANMAAVVLMSLRSQLISLHTTGICSFYFNAIKEGVKPYYVLTMAKLGSRVLCLKGLAPFLPLPDWQILADEGVDFFLLPLLLYLCSVGIVWILATSLTASLIFWESAVHKIALKFLARAVTGTLSFSDWLMKGLQKLPCVVATALVILSMTTCGGLALCIGTVFYFLKLTQMSQDYIEELVLHFVKFVAKKLKRRISPQDERNMPSDNSSQYSQTRDENNSSSNVEIVNKVRLGQGDCSGVIKNENETCDTNDVDGSISTESNSPETVAQSSRINGEGEETNGASTCEENDDELTESAALNAAQTGGDENTNEEPQVLAEVPTHSSIYFHFTLFMLWAIVTGLNLPFVLTWAHNFKYNPTLQPDPSFLPGITLCVCALPLWQLDLPKGNKRCYMELSNIIYVLAVSSLIFAPIFVYRLSYIISAAIVLITLHQLLAPNRSSLPASISSPEGPEQPEHDSIGRMKAKWE